MTNQPLVSIALTTFNGEKFLTEQMDSLLAQDYSNFEIVVSDDNSTDSTWKILHRYAAQDQRIRLLPRNENRGVVQNFAYCFSACLGDLISPSDQDDIWHPSKTRRLVEAMDDALLVYCNSRYVDGQGKHTGLTVAHIFNMIHGDDPRPFLFSNSVFGHAMLFHRRLLDGQGAITNVPHDWWLAFVASSIDRVIYLDETLVDYRRHETSVTNISETNRSPLQKKKFIDDDTLRLDAMANFPGPYQAYAKKKRDTWQAWYNSYFDLTMFLSVLFKASDTHRAYLKNKTPLQLAMKYLAGHRLKNLLRPSYYQK